MSVISVICPPDKRLHLAPEGEDNRGLGVSKFTLCLERWKDRTDCYADSEFCTECLEKFKLRGASDE